MRRRTWLKGPAALMAAILGATSTAAADREVAATVLGQAIHRDELRRPEELSARIIRPLMQRFVSDNGLTVTPSEIDELQTALKMPPPPAGLSEAERAVLRQFLEGMVLNWKISGALYRRYGGDVIFQQANPLEPVGAMRLFLEEQEASGAFVIPDAADRERFWAYYKRRHPFVVPPAQVDYSRPWWRR